LHFLGSFETAIRLIPNSEIHNSHIRRIELGEDNCNFLKQTKSAYTTNMSYAIKAIKHLYNSDLLNIKPTDLFRDLQCITS